MKHHNLLCVSTQLRKSVFVAAIIGTISAATATLATPATDAEAFCIAGCPATPAGDTLIVHHLFALSNNPTTKMADWVAYRITASTLGRGCKRIWAKDPALPPGDTLAPDDYQDARSALHVDRGHQAPLASLCDSGAPDPHWREDDYLSNITPQASDLNEGPWERLEAAERALVSNHIADSVYTLTGPLFERDAGHLPHAPTVRIPSGYWKVIAIRSGSQLHAAAFIMDQSLSRDADYCQSYVSFWDVETRVHLRLFSKTDQKQKRRISELSITQNLGCTFQKEKRNA